MASHYANLDTIFGQDVRLDLHFPVSFVIIFSWSMFKDAHLNNFVHYFIIDINNAIIILSLCT